MNNKQIVNSYSGFMRQFEMAAAETREMKKIAPHIFPEWQELCAALEAAKVASIRLKAAHEAWNRLGESRG